MNSRTAIFAGYCGRKYLIISILRPSSAIGTQPDLGGPNYRANPLTKRQAMYLIFPDSMVIPEVTSRREDNHFEDWLTATLIENTNQEQKDDPESKLPGITDLWMLEIAERNGKTWMGTFQVKFETGDQGRKSNDTKSDQKTGVLFFSINTDTGEVKFA
jgi:hypothetical protein